MWYYDYHPLPDKAATLSGGTPYVLEFLNEYFTIHIFLVQVKNSIVAYFSALRMVDYMRMFLFFLVSVLIFFL